MNETAARLMTMILMVGTSVLMMMFLAAYLTMNPTTEENAR